MGKQTAMEQLIQYIEEFTPKNKTTDGIWSKAKSLIELEKQQAHEYAEFAIRCDRKEMKILNFDGFINLE